MFDHHYPFIPLEFCEMSLDAMQKASKDFYETLSKRRTVRQFSSRSIDKRIIDNAIRSAGSAPSGANKQPWHFMVVSNHAIKKEIRNAAEKEERSFYERRAPRSWLDDLAPLGTHSSKPFLEEAPYLIVVFLQRYTIDKTGCRHKNYYMSESVGIACGILLTALHFSGLVTLTHTPSPMSFLNKILNRDSHEKPFLLVVTGYPSVNAKVPYISRKPLQEIASYID